MKGTSLTGGSNGEVTKHSPFRSLALAFALIVLTAVMPIAWPTSQRPARPQMLEDMTVTQVTTPTDWWAEHPQVKATVDARRVDASFAGAFVAGMTWNTYGWVDECIRNNS